MKIRIAKKRDIPSLKNLWWQMHMTHYDFDKEYYRLAAKSKALKATEKYFSHAIDDYISVFLVVEEDGKIAGFLKARIEERPPVFHKQKSLFIDIVVVDEKFRKKGIYSEFQTHIERIAKVEGISYIRLNVDVVNEEAKKVYLRKGFVPRNVLMIKKVKRRK